MLAALIWPSFYYQFSSLRFLCSYGSWYSTILGTVELICPFFVEGAVLCILGVTSLLLGQWGFFPGIRETVKGFGQVQLWRTMEDLTQNWSCLTLTDREGLGCSLTSVDSLEEFSIIAKFFMKRALSIEQLLKLSILYGGLTMVSKFRTMEIKRFYLLLTTRMTLRELSQVSHGVLTSIWL